MTDWPTCQRPVDGLFCVHCGPKAPKNPPIPAKAKAEIDRVLARHRKRPDREAELERVAIQEESAW